MLHSVKAFVLSPDFGWCALANTVLYINGREFKISSSFMTQLTFLLSKKVGNLAAEYFALTVPFLSKYKHHIKTVSLIPLTGLLYLESKDRHFSPFRFLGVLTASLVSLRVFARVLQLHFPEANGRDVSLLTNLSFYFSLSFLLEAKKTSPNIPSYFLKGSVIFLSKAVMNSTLNLFNQKGILDKTVEPLEYKITYLPGILFAALDLKYPQNSHLIIGAFLILECITAFFLGKFEIKIETEQALAVLGLDPHATDKMIKEKFKELALKHHPDKNPNGKEMFVKITKAYGILTGKKDVNDAS